METIDSRVTYVVKYNAYIYIYIHVCVCVCVFFKVFHYAWDCRFKVL
jgi:hypothetical protein